MSKLKWSAKTESSTLTVLVGLPLVQTLFDLLDILSEEKQNVLFCVCACVCMYVCVFQTFKKKKLSGPVELFLFGPVLICIYMFLPTLLISGKKIMCMCTHRDPLGILVCLFLCVFVCVCVLVFWMSWLSIKFALSLSLLYIVYHV